MEVTYLDDTCYVIIVEKEGRSSSAEIAYQKKLSQAEIELAEQSIKENEEELRLSSRLSSVVLLLLSSTPLSLL